jgi:hypothetical protein
MRTLKHAVLSPDISNSAATAGLGDLTRDWLTRGRLTRLAQTIGTGRLT